MKTRLRLLASLFATAALFSSAARAVIVYTPSNLTLGIGQSATIDFDQNGVPDLLLDVDGGGSVSFNARGEPGPTDYAQTVNFVYMGIYNPPVNYAANVSIGGSLPIASTGYFRIFAGGTEYGKFADTRGFAAAVIQTGTFNLGSGFSLQNTYYGWLDLEVVTTSSTQTLQLHGWAFESIAGVSILTGAGATAVPEPSTYATLAGLAALGLAGWRKRRGH